MDIQIADLPIHHLHSHQLHLSPEEEHQSRQQGNPHLAFEKNYPKNIFITLIQHLGQKGLRAAYEECVGSRESFQSKNVVSLAQIHKLISQSWFRENINLTALVSNMSNKILMNSKIKKKLFHLLLIKQLFTLPSFDCKIFKKVISKKANDITTLALPSHPLFNHPSALIYLLRLLAQGLQKGVNQSLTDHLQSEQLIIEDENQKGSTLDQNQANGKNRSKQSSSKEQSKFYITKIICSLNQFTGNNAQLFDLLQQIKHFVDYKEEEVRDLYNLPKHVPQWNYFGQIVIDNCMMMKKNKQRLTFSIFNQWIAEFREMTTSNRGFMSLSENWPVEKIEHFKPIIIIQPPCIGVN